MQSKLRFHLYDKSSSFVGALRKNQSVPRRRETSERRTKTNSGAADKKRFPKICGAPHFVALEQHRTTARSGGKMIFFLLKKITMALLTNESAIKG